MLPSVFDVYKKPDGYRNVMTIKEGLPKVGNVAACARAVPTVADQLAGAVGLDAAVGSAVVVRHADRDLVRRALDQGKRSTAEAECAKASLLQTTRDRTQAPRA